MLKMEETMWRQGDVLMEKVKALPEGAALQSGRSTLFTGEITGHAHRLEVPENAELWECQGVLYMKVVAKTANIVHEEHKPITLPEGIYRVWRQREYTPQAIRDVMD